MPNVMAAAEFVMKLKNLCSVDELKKIQRYFKTGAGDYGTGDEFIGVRMGQVFALAKEFMEMPLDEIEKLLESQVHEIRVGGVSIMDWQVWTDGRRPASERLRLRLKRGLSTHAA